MNAPQTKKLGMYKLLRVFLLLPVSVTITNKWKSFSKWFTKFSSTIDLIEATSTAQEDAKAKTASSKTEARNKLRDKIIGITRKCLSYVEVEAESDFDLRDFFKYIRDNIRAVSDELLITHGRSLLAKITELKVPLADYDVTTDSSEELSKLIDDFNKIYKKPESDTQEISQLTEQLDAQFTENDYNLGKMDSIVDAGFEQEPEFHATYFLKRHIGKPGYHKVALIMKVYDEQGNPLSRALVVLTPADEHGSPQAERKTGKKGGVVEKTMLVAKYNYRVIYGGLQDATGSLYIHEGLTTKLNIVMKKA